jgi:predicted TIM-barrel fold metal-dependent hydrolase
MTKHVPTRIINAHAHYHPGELEQRAEQWQAAGLLATCICAAGEAQNQPVLDLRSRFGGFVIPFGYVALGRDTADAVTRLKDRGFVGLKFLHSPLPYSDPRLFPIYERAAELKMPGMFHTGWAAGANAKRSLNMMPSELEPVCKTFPEWKFVAAHLGNWWAQDAVGLMEQHPNVYFDLSGGFIRKQSPTWLRSLFLRQPDKNLRRIEEVVDHSLIARLVFATDNPPLEELLEFYVNLLNWLQVPLDVQNKVYYDNIAQILAEADYEPPAHT